MQDPERYGWFSLAVSLGQHGIIGRWDHGISPVLDHPSAGLWASFPTRELKLRSSCFYLVEAQVALTTRIAPPTVKTAPSVGVALM